MRSVKGKTLQNLAFAALCAATAALGPGLGLACAQSFYADDFRQLFSTPRTICPEQRFLGVRQQRRTRLESGQPDRYQHA